MQGLQIEQFPLTPGIRLIEASAGTGKTYTIANLYLRLLLQQNHAVEQILVVTFTEAATFELRERIRKRLAQALQELHNEQPDGLLHAIIADIGRDTCMERLQQALTQIDEAAIFTIHGFCTRVLAEHAFESGVPFEMVFIGDEHEYIEQVVEDYWRSQSYQLQPPLLDWWLNWAPTPEELIGKLRPLLADDLSLIPEAQDTDALLQQYQACYQKFCQLLKQDFDELSRYLLESRDLNRQKYRVATMQKLLDDLQQLPAAETRFVLAKNLEKLATQALSAGLKKDAQLLSLPLFDCVEELISLNQQLLNGLQVAFLHQARDYVRRHLQQQKQRHGVLAFDDLLRNMDQALQGPHAEHLAQVLVERYSCAMIDEFQDTDAMQYRIFQRIYKDNGSLFLIGDPKQAIYSFRNADIFTYMQAKRAILQQPDSGFTLDTNWRSSTAMVNAVNQLFQYSPAPFVYQDDIPFQAVKPAGQQGGAEHKLLQHKGQALPALQWWLMPGEDNKPISAKVYEPIVMARCCDEAVRLLKSAQQGELMMGERALQPQDIAFLVRENSQGFAIQQLLAERGIDSVFVKRESVYQSYEATQLLVILQAVMHYRVEEGVRAALATSLLTYSAAQIDALLEDESQWEALLNRFASLHQTWQQHGFMRMFRQLLQQFEVITRINRMEGRDRCLTNLLHLSELIAQLEPESYGVEALLRAYEEAIVNADSERESEQLRLENEANLVTIITIHKSKGLQYPVVFLPFVARGKKPREDAPFHHPELGRCRDLGSADKEQSEALAAREALAEDIRLLYVALTRAEQRCYLPLARAYGYEHSAMAYLLHGDQDKARLSDADLQQSLQAIYRDQPGVSIDALPEESTAVYNEASSAVATKPVRQFQGDLQHDWWVTSYSYLTSNQHSYSAGQDYEQSEVVTEEEILTPQVIEAIFEFPRGAQAGQCLHAIFENIDFADGKSWSPVVEHWLQRYGFDESWQATVLQMLDEVLDCELEPGLSLGAVSETRRLNEMAVYFPIDDLNAKTLNHYLQGQSSAGRRPLQFNRIQGMMKGFIDLVFEHSGRFYIVDYKSNHLGNRVEDYGQDQVEAAIIDHDYDLQYLIYSLALHRYLQLRLPDYDFEQHFGGVYYLFLRGIRKQQGTDFGVHQARPSLADIQALEQLMCGGGHG
jgi:exodeoxyribonuclease V beta subunit